MTTSTPPLPWPALPSTGVGRHKPLTAELGLTAEAGMVSWCRGRAAEILGEWAVDPPVIQEAVLILSELVTNAVVHGQCPIDVRLELDRWEGTLVGAVADEGPGWPTPRDAGCLDSLDEGGRGLLLVGLMSTRWGVTREADGVHKTAWFCIAVPPSATGTP